MQQQTPPEQFDLQGLVADLNSLLRLKTTVIGMKMFASVDEMAAIPKIRRPTAVHTTDQIVSMASRLGWTVGITADDLVGAQCRAVIGLAPQDDAVPFSFFLLLARLVVPHLGRRHVQGRHGRTTRCISQFGIASEIADQNDFVDASHTVVPFDSERDAPRPAIA